MAIFKKKNVEETKEETKDIKLQILEKLNEKINGTLYDNAILIPRFGFSIDIQVAKNEVKENFNILNVIFILKSDELDEPIIEPVPAQGDSLESAITMAVESFSALLWHPLQMLFNKQKSMPMSSNYLGQHYDYDMYAQSVVLMGDPDKKPSMLINHIKDVLPHFLGSKKYYWVRIFLARHKDKKTIEVRINGTPCPSLNQNFQKYLDSWADKDTFVAEKQYAIIVNKADDECPFTKQHVVECTRKTLELMENCKSQEEYIDLKNKMEEFTGNPALAAEIRIFIPEILAKLTLGYREGDSLFLIDGNSQIEFKKTQLRSYFYIQQVLLDYLSRVKPEKEKVTNIVANSVAFKELKNHIGKENEALGRPIEAKDLFVKGTSFKVGVEDYKVW